MMVKVKQIVGESPGRRRHVQSAYYRQARTFEIAADLLLAIGQNIDAKTAIASSERFNAVIPMVVSHSFATELFLKCLLQIEDLYAEGHHLGKLFEKLTPSHQSRIESAYERRLGTPQAGFKVIEILNRSGEAFIEWRYLNEDKPPKMPGGVYDAGTLLPDIKQIIWEEIPELKWMLPTTPAIG